MATIKQTMAQEKANKIAAAEAAARQAGLDAIEPINIVETMDEVVNNTARTYRDETGRLIGMNGGKLFQIPMFLPDGTPTTISAATKEEAEALKEAIANGMQGDGKYHKLVNIGGLLCDCAGATPEELQQDIKNAENYHKLHSGHVIRDIDVAEQLVDAEFEKEDLKYVDINGTPYFINKPERSVFDRFGSTKCDLSDLSNAVQGEDAEKILIERLLDVIAEEEAAAALSGLFSDDEDDYYDEEDYED